MKIYFKYFVLITILTLLILGLFKPFSSKLPEHSLARYTHQKNPFRVGEDSAEIVWARASKYLEDPQLIIVGGSLQISHSLIYMPYYNDFHKGTSLSIERKTIVDSVMFTVKVWNSEKPNELGAKAIAHYMHTGIDK